MDLTQIKTKLNIDSLQLSTSEKDGVKTQWMRHWDNDRRIAVSIHMELISELQKDPAINSLGLQKETKNGSKGMYTAYRIIKYKPAETVL